MLAAFRDAQDGKVVMRIIHGVPDTAHPNVTTSPELFERYLRFWRDEHDTVLAFRDLKKCLPARAQPLAVPPGDR